MMLVIRNASDDFAAFKIGETALQLGGLIVSVTVSPIMVFDHIQGHQRADMSGRWTWIRTIR